MTWLWIALGAALGAPARYLTDRWVQRHHDSVFPWGTLTVNVVASLVVGVLAGAAHAVSPALALLVGTGFCGALSTYSTFSYETLRLVENRARFLAVAHVVVALLAGFGAVALGWTVGVALS